MERLNRRISNKRISKENLLPLIRALGAGPRRKLEFGFSRTLFEPLSKNSRFTRLKVETHLVQ